MNHLSNNLYFGRILKKIFNFEKTEPTTLNNIELSSLENYIENEDINFSISEISDSLSCLFKIPPKTLG